VAQLWRAGDQGSAEAAGAGPATRSGRHGSVTAARHDHRVVPPDVEVTAALRGLPLFAGVPEDRLASIDPPPELLDVLAGETIVREGRYDHEWYVIVAGTAAATVAGSELGRLGRGEHFGEIALLSRRPRRVSVRAVTPMRVVMLTEKAFLALLEDCAPFTYAVLARLAERAASPHWPTLIERPTIGPLPGRSHGA